MRNLLTEAEGECRALMRRLGAQHQWPAFRMWIVAQAILPQLDIDPRQPIRLWIEETVPGEIGTGDAAQLTAVAAQSWLPALRRAPLAAFRLLPAESGLAGVSAARLRLGEVAGFLDGLLNRATDPPQDPRCREEVARLEAIEELLDGLSIEGGPQARAADIVIGNLVRAAEEGIGNLATIFRDLPR